MLSTKTSPPLSFATLLARSPADQQALGYADTVREILQQPITWPRTARAVAAQAIDLAASPTPIILTGSGSSFYIAECLAITLQESLGVATRAVASGDLLTHARGILPPADLPLTLISLA